MKIYKCICEALDYGKNPNAIKDLKEILSSVDGVTIKEEFYEPGTIEEGASAGVIVEVSEDAYFAASHKIGNITSKKYGVDEYFFRIGLGIIGEVSRSVKPTMESNYCKICKLYGSCKKSKTCSCENFETDVEICNNGCKTLKYI